MLGKRITAFLGIFLVSLLLIFSIASLVSAYPVKIGVSSANGSPFNTSIYHCTSSSCSATDILEDNLFGSYNNFSLPNRGAGTQYFAEYSYQTCTTPWVWRWDVSTSTGNGPWNITTNPANAANYLRNFTQKEGCNSTIFSVDVSNSTPVVGQEIQITGIVRSMFVYNAFVNSIPAALNDFYSSNVTVKLYVGGQNIENKSYMIVAGQNQTVTFNYTPANTGSQNIGIETTIEGDCRCSSVINNTLNITNNNITINKAGTNTTVITIPNSSIVYGTASNFSCLNSANQPTNMSINGTYANAEQGLDIIRAAGTYTINCSFDENSNYLASSEQVTYVINQSNSGINLYLNNSIGNATVNQGDFIWLNASFANGTGNIELYNNGTLVDNSSAPSNFTQFNSLGLYNITAIYYGNENYTGSTQTFFVTVIDSTNPTINFTDFTEVSGSYINRSNIMINVTANDTNLLNIILYNYNASELYNLTNVSAPINNLELNLVSLIDGIYFFNASACDTSNNCAGTETRNVTIDTTKPQINFTDFTEVSGSQYNQSNIAINISYNELNLANFIVELYNSSGFLINSSLTNETVFTLTESGIYFFNASACDLAGNCNSTETRNVTIDLTGPEYENTPLNETYLTYAFGQQYNFTINFTEQTTSVDTVILNFNGNSYTMSGNGQYNVSLFDLAAGNYSYFFWANNSLGNTNQTPTYILAINKAIPALNVSLTSPITYNASSDYTANEVNNGDDDLFYALYLNDTQIANGSNVNDTQILGAGNYVYIYNSTEGQNYTSTTNSASLSVNPTYQIISLNVTPNNTIIYGNLVNVTCNGNLMISYNNENYTALGSGSDLDLAAGNYSFWCFLNASQNYTYNETFEILTILQANGSGSLLLNDNNANVSLVYFPSSINASFTNSTGSAVLYRNGLTITNLNNLFEDLGAGNYNFTLVIPESQNYTSYLSTLFATISQANGSVFLYLNDSRSDINLTDPSSIQINATRNNGTGALSLYLNGILLNTTNSLEVTYTQLFNVTGFYNVTAIDSSDENYTSGFETFFANVSDITAPTGQILGPENNSMNRTNIQNFTLNASDNFGLANATLYIYNSSGLYNQTTIIMNGLVSVVGIPVYLVDGVYTWFWQLTDVNNQISLTENNTITIDTNGPLIQIVSPENGTYNSTSTSRTVEILINITNSSDAQSTWFFNGTENVSYGLETYLNFTEGSHTIIAYSNDSLGNMNQTSVTFNVYLTRNISNSWIYGIFYEYNQTIDVLNTNVTNSNITDTNVSGLTNFEIINSTLRNSTLTNVNVIRNCTVLDSTKIGGPCVNTIIDPSTVVESDTTGSTITDSEIYYSNVTDSTINNAFINNSNINLSYVLGATIQGSNLTNANVTGDSNITDSILIDSNVSEAGNITNSTLNSSVLIGGLLNNSIVYNSTFTNSTLSNVNVNNSIILNATLNFTTILDANITNGIIYTGTIVLPNGTTWNTTASGTLDLNPIFNPVTVITNNNGGGGGGGGGGGSCKTTWNCTAWTKCSNDTQTRTCVKLDDRCIADPQPVLTNACLVFIDVNTTKTNVTNLTNSIEVGIIDSMKENVKVLLGSVGAFIGANKTPLIGVVAFIAIVIVAYFAIKIFNKPSVKVKYKISKTKSKVVRIRRKK